MTWIRGRGARSGGLLGTLVGVIAAGALTACSPDAAPTTSPTSTSTVDSSITTTSSTMAATTTTSSTSSTSTTTTVPLPPVHGGCLRDGFVPVTFGEWPREWDRIRVDTIRSTWLIARYPFNGPRGAVVVVGDSLTVNSIGATMESLIDAGFGPVCIDGLSGRTTRPLSEESRVLAGLSVAQRIIDSDPIWSADSTRWVVALGTNDAALARATDLRTDAVDTILEMCSLIGQPQDRILWVNVRTIRPVTLGRELTWNSALSSTDVHVVDWASLVSLEPGVHIRASDLVHLDPAGQELRALMIVTELSAQR